MKITAEKSVKLEDGKHTGVIDDIQYRSDPYAYTDIVIKIDDMTLKAGYPSNIMEDSALGQLLKRFGAKIIVGEDYDVESFITKGMAVDFMVITETSKKDGKDYCNIIRESLKPAK